MCRIFVLGAGYSLAEHGIRLQQRTCDLGEGQPGHQPQRECE
ncbi:hypothetical protein [Mycobacterium lepromatosis]|nr:hypothetical protein [Mycobacterium lepromatosis]